MAISNQETLFNLLFYLRSNIRLLEVGTRMDIIAIGSDMQSSFLRSNIRQLELKTAKLHF